MDMVRLRNALLLAPTRSGDFDWTPANIPHDFITDEAPRDAELESALAELDCPGATELGRALSIAGGLVRFARDQGPIRAELSETYKRIREGYGFCSDYAKVFVALSCLAGIPVRQWGFSRSFGANGHAFVEIWDSTLQKWVFLDVFNNFHVTDPAGVPLSALEFRAALDDPSGVRIVPNGPGRPGWPEQNRLFDYYRAGLPYWYLWWGTSILSVHRGLLVRAAAKISPRLANFAAPLSPRHPRLHILETKDNERDRSRLRTDRTVIAATALVLAIVIAAFIGIREMRSDELPMIGAGR